MAAKSGSFDFCKALAGISTKDDHAETATSNNDSDDTCRWENFDLDVYMDCEEYDRMSCKAQKLFAKLDGERTSEQLSQSNEFSQKFWKEYDERCSKLLKHHEENSADACKKEDSKRMALQVCEKDTPSKEIQDTSKTSKGDKTYVEEWHVSQQPSHWQVYLSREKKQQSPKKLTYEWEKEVEKAFKCLPTSVLVELEKEVVEYRKKYMEMCTQQYSELYKPTKDYPDVTVEKMLQHLVEQLVLNSQDEDWELTFSNRPDDEPEDSWYFAQLHCVRAISLHFNVCTKNQVQNIVALLNLPFTDGQKFTDELFHVIVYWITDPTFGPILAEIIGEVILKAGTCIYDFLVECIADYLCPQQKTLLTYKKVRDILVFYLCAKLVKCTDEDIICDIVSCLVKLDGHESWAIVEDAFERGKYNSKLDDYYYVDYLEDQNLGVPDVDALRSATCICRHEPSQSDENSQKFWKEYDERCLKLVERHEENCADPSYCNMQRCKNEDSKRMALQVCEFLEKYQEAGKSKKDKHNGMSSSMIEVPVCKKCQEEERNGEVPVNKQSKDTKEKKIESTNSTKTPDTPVANGSKAPGPGKVPLNFKTYKIRECGFCGKLSTPELKFSKCASCLHVYYCSRGCQKQHWKAGHKNQCNKK